MEKSLRLNSNEEAIALYGTLDENLRRIESDYHVRVAARNHRLKIIGAKKDVDAAYRYLAAQLTELRRAGGKRAPSEGGGIRREVPRDPGDGFAFVHRGKTITARGQNQEAYLATIDRNDIVVCIGPAGTGKTYLAMAVAIDYLKNKRVGRIVLTRPAVEAGESLGFLPGDLREKINPYLRPLYDALYDMMDFEEAGRYLERGVIEVAPLAYMRGRTLNDSFVILDEAQNCTHSQVKMFLTRLGQSSKAVLTGDITQIDLPAGTKSGLVEAQRIISPIPGVGFVYLKECDVVRHRLVQDIIVAYEKYDAHEKKH